MSLHDTLLAAHAAGDGVAMVTLYLQAAEGAESLDEEMFFLTQAYVFALEHGKMEAVGIASRLRRHGRI
ncbi:MAG: hypothetical protein AAFP13_00760 [Pseudomonadota bacterium]